MPEVIFNGPEGRLEGRYQHGSQPNAPIALMLHPHPQHGGTMNNKIVYSLYHNFVQRGFSVLRFNFRGVGRSQGVYDRGEGELSDAASALDWLQTYNPNAGRRSAASSQWRRPPTIMISPSLPPARPPASWCRAQPTISCRRNR